MGFQETDIHSLEFNPFDKISKQWMLITAGDSMKSNTMTASWGSLGELWGSYVSTVHIRPQRYTLEFVEKQDFYSVCFFDEEYRSALTVCGKVSGRDCDKDQEAGLTPVFDQAAPYYQEARLVLICRKLYKQDMKPECFLDRRILDKHYTAGDVHRTFIGEIVKVLERD